MTKLKKMRIKLYGTLGVLCLVIIVGAALVVSANNGVVQRIIENVEVYNEAPAQEPVVEGDVTLGAVSGPDMPYQYFSVNGDTVYSFTGDFNDATTTLVSIPSPFLKATSSALDIVVNWETEGRKGKTVSTTTVELVRLDLSAGASSSMMIRCGASVNKAVTPAQALLYTSTISTSSAPIIENNISSTTASNWGIPSTGNLDKIFLTPEEPFLNCYAYGGGPDDGNLNPDAKVIESLTGTTNTLEGKFLIRMSKVR